MYASTEPTTNVDISPILINEDSLAQINNGLLQGNLSLVTRHADDGDLKKLFSKEGELLLMNIKNSINTPDIKQLHKATKFLFLIHHVVPLTHYLHSDLVFVNTPSSDIVSLLLSCAERIASSLGYDADTLAKELLKSEPLRSSFICDGIAAPRVFSPKARQITCAVFQIPEGVEYIPSSKLTCKLLFFILCPEASSNLVQDMIKEINKLGNSKPLMEELLKPQTNEEFFLNLHRDFED